MKKKLALLLAGVLMISICFAQNTKELPPAAFQEKLGETVTVLDVRTPEEFKAGAIKGAVLADWWNKSDFAAQTAKLDKTKPIYIYCLSGVRSAEAAAALRKKGFTVTELKGGIKAWQKAGLPVTHE